MASLTIAVLRAANCRKWTVCSSLFCGVNKRQHLLPRQLPWQPSLLEPSPSIGPCLQNSQRMYSAYNDYEIVDTDNTNEEKGHFHSVYSLVAKTQIQGVNIACSSAVSLSLVWAVKTIRGLMETELTLQPMLQHLSFLVLAGVVSYVLLTSRKIAFDIYLNEKTRQVKVTSLTFFGCKHSVTADPTSLVYLQLDEKHGKLELKNRHHKSVIWFVLCHPGSKKGLTELSKMLKVR